MSQVQPKVGSVLDERVYRRVTIHDLLSSNVLVVSRPERRHNVVTEVIRIEEAVTDVVVYSILSVSSNMNQRQATAKVLNGSAGSSYWVTK